MLIVLPESIHAQTNPDVYISAFNINVHSTIRIFKIKDVYCVGLTQDFYNNKYTQKHYYISEHKSQEEASAEIEKILEAFEKHHKVYRIEPNLKVKKTTSDPEKVIGAYIEVKEGKQ